MRTKISSLVLSLTMLGLGFAACAEQQPLAPLPVPGTANAADIPQLGPLAIGDGQLNLVPPHLDAAGYGGMPAQASPAAPFFKVQQPSDAWPRALTLLGAVAMQAATASSADTVGFRSLTMYQQTPGGLKPVFSDR